MHNRAAAVLLALLLSLSAVLPCHAQYFFPWNIPAEEMGKTVTVSYAADGNGMPVYPSFEAQVGSTFVLPAAPDIGREGLRFLCWSVNGMSYDPGETVVVTGALTVQYSMKKESDMPPGEGECQFSFLSGWSPDVGGLSPGTMEKITLPRGSVYTLPECGFRSPDGYRFVGWRIGGQFYSPGESFVLDQNQYAVATWERENVEWPEMEVFTVRIDVVTDGGGTAYPSGDVTVAKGDSLSIDLIPDPGYYLGSIELNGRLVEAVSPLVLHTVSTPYIVEVRFYPTKDGSTQMPGTPQYPAPAPLDPWAEVPIPEEPVSDIPADSAPVLPIFPKEPEISADPDTLPAPEEVSAGLYADVPYSLWYAPDVAFVTEKNLMNGVGEGRFAPENVTDRAMLVTILWRMEGEPPVGPGEDFLDVEPDMWYTDAVRWAASHGIVNGYGNGRFGPADPLTREQTVAILYRYACIKNWTEKEFLPITRSFTYSPWAEESVFWGENHGIFADLGTDVTDQTAQVTRAEAAAYLRRFCENLRP